MEYMIIDPSLREDFLEAIFNLARDGRRLPTTHDIAAALKKQRGRYSLS